MTVENNTSSNFSSTEPPTIYPALDGPSTFEPIPPQQPTGSSKLNCQIVGKTRINCSSEVYSDPATWRLSRDYLEQQIRILRVQLDELKVIRKHLRAMRPFDSGPLLSPPSSSLSTETDTPVVEYQRCRKFRQLSTKSTTTKESQKPSSEGDQEGEEKVASSGPVVNQVCFFFSFLEFDSFFFTLIVFFIFS